MTKSCIKKASFKLFLGDKVRCHICLSEEGTGRGQSPSRSLLAVPNVTVHSSTASVSFTILLYNVLLMCGLMCPLKG